MASGALWKEEQGLEGFKNVRIFFSNTIINSYQARRFPVATFDMVFFTATENSSGVWSRWYLSLANPLASRNPCSSKSCRLGKEKAVPFLS